MGNCGSAPKTKGDDADNIPTPAIPKEESVRANVEEAVKVEQEEKTETADDSNVNADAEKKETDYIEVKPVDDNNQPSLGNLLTETKEKEEKIENEKKPEGPSEKEESEEQKAEQKKENTEPAKVPEAAAAGVTQ